MAQPDNAIRGALNNHLALLANVPPIAPENVDFDQPPPYLRTTLVFSGQEALSILNPTSASVVDTGLFLVDCFTRPGIGTAAADTLAAAVRRHFRPGLLLLGNGGARVRLQNNSRAEGRTNAENEQPAYFVPVSISWRCAYHVG